MKHKDLNKAELACLEFYEKSKKSNGFIRPEDLDIYAAGEEISEKLEADRMPLILSCGDKSIDISEMVRPKLMSMPQHVHSDIYYLCVPLAGKSRELELVFDLIREFA